MSRLNATDIQGFALRGYNMPYARYCFLHFGEAAGARKLISEVLKVVTTGQLWEQGKPDSTLNIAFTHLGLVALHLPLATLISFPVEFQEGMRARARILGDVGMSAPERWDPMWQSGEVHAWVAIHAVSTQALEVRFAATVALIEGSAGVNLVGMQDAAALLSDGKVTLREHFGFIDGFGNPDYLGICRDTQPGQGKRMPDGSWAPLATGELLLGHADEAGELPVAPVPHILAENGTFMVYRKLHQNVGTFRSFLNRWASRYGRGDGLAREKLAAKFIGRWRDGTPLELSPDAPDSTIAQDPRQSTNFLYGDDLDGARCPIGAHIRRVHPRDAFGFAGKLVDRRRITRRGMPYGPYLESDDSVAGAEPNAPELDAVDRGVIFVALNASLSRQFEFVQQQWVAYGNDARLGNEKDLLMANHEPGERYSIQGDRTVENPPLFCTELPNFVELRGGEYFFLPSVTALGMLSMGLVDPR